MTTTAETLAHAGAAAAQIIGAELGAPQLIKDATRAVIARAAVLTGGPPRSVIIKQIRDDPATGFSEWASLQFLSAAGAAPGLAPAFLGGDVGTRLFVMSDLGPGRTLGELLSAGGPAEAKAALEGLARQMARLHAATLGGESAFAELRAALPAAEATGRRPEAERWLAGHDRVVAWLEATGCAAPAGFAAALGRVAECYADPEDWLTFSHGDPAPSNNHIADGVVRLVDFEYGAFRHALYDLSAWNTLCPLPRREVGLMCAAFRAELAGSLPVAGDDAAFGRAWATLCAFRGLAVLSWLPPAALLEGDRPWAEGWSAREAALAAASRTAEAAAAAPELAPIALAAGELEMALRARWPELAGRAEIATRWAALGPRGR